MRRVPDILTRNERVAILGRWPYGFLSLVAVGATNVGSIEVDFADKVRTNLYADSFGKVKSHFIGVPGEEVSHSCAPKQNDQQNPISQGSYPYAVVIDATVVAPQLTQCT